jgi:protein TonB
MSGVLEGSERLEQELTPEPVMAPAAGAVALHLGLVAGIVLYGILGGFFRHNFWGGSSMGGAIQVNLVSNALPLPSTQPVNQNVLATETPSQAPAPPQPKAKQAVDETAIPILGKQKKPLHETAQRTPPRQQQPVQNNRAAYGEQAGSSMPHATQQQGFTSGQTAVNTDFGSQFGWYVDQLNRTMAGNWYKPEVDPHTPHGAQAYIFFKIYRDGSVADVQLARTSGSPTLDNSCVRAAQRVSNFQSLPGQYRGSYLQVSYYCEY